MNPKISIVIPFHFMEKWPTFLVRCLATIEMQTFKDYEVIIEKVGSMPITSNSVISAAKGELIKILYMDDYFATADALQEIVDAFEKDTKWLVTGCVHDDGTGEAKNPHTPSYNDDIHTGKNTIGSPSVLTMRRECALFFDEKLSWLLDCDLYKRLHDTYGAPTILNTSNVVIGIHPGQTSNLMSEKLKKEEGVYLRKKYSHA